MPKSKVMFNENPISRRGDVRKRLSEGFDSNDPLRLFLAGTETKQLLTFEEESELIARVQVYIQMKTFSD